MGEPASSTPLHRRLPSAISDLRTIAESLSRVAELIDRLSRSDEASTEPDEAATAQFHGALATLEDLRRRTALWVERLPAGPLGQGRDQLASQAAIVLAEIASQGTTLAMVIIGLFGEEEDAPSPPPPGQHTEFQRALQESAGLWTRGDGLEYQQRMREQWESAK